MGIIHTWLVLLVHVQYCMAFSIAGHENTCEANGSVYYVGEWYFLDSDHCTQCECTAEGSACARTECTPLPSACIHVSHYPTDCCPRCEKIGCEYRGEVYDLGEQFQVEYACLISEILHNNESTLCYNIDRHCRTSSQIHSVSTFFDCAGLREHVAKTHHNLLSPGLSIASEKKKTSPHFMHRRVRLRCYIQLNNIG